MGKELKAGAPANRLFTRVSTQRCPPRAHGSSSFATSLRLEFAFRIENERANVQAQKCSIKATYYNNIATLDYTLYGLFPDWT